MTNIRVEIKTTITRDDGSQSIVTESDHDDCGGNPRFERAEVERLIEVVASVVTDKVQGVTRDQLESRHVIKRAAP